MIRTLLAEDAPAFRVGLRQLLEADGRFAVVGEAEDGLEAISQAVLLQPDLVVMDVRMPRLDGVSAAHEVHRRAPDATVVILTELDSAALRAGARAAGCAAYILKSEDLRILPDRLATAVRASS